ncbi:MAG: type II toxin-antitoxin system RelE/ParE family toxin [Promicromonosporaceae bacterium]|nr:type II toxin-antitoxin system RelE/ParE family toxin [Promicromonosporaceae bacterium]
MAWQINSDLIEDWLSSLDPKSFDRVNAALIVLSEIGPGLGRPLVDSVKCSRHRNMKELRPGSAGGSKVRILFAFDPARQAILLVAGDKAGRWQRWYQQMIPLADDRYDEHLETL